MRPLATEEVSCPPIFWGVGRERRPVESHRPPLQEGRVTSHGVALSFYAWSLMSIQCPTYGEWLSVPDRSRVQILASQDRGYTVSRIWNMDFRESFFFL